MGACVQRCRVTGTTPAQYVAARSHQRAVTLLGEPGSLVATTAEQFGIPSPVQSVDPSRQRPGITPGAYLEAALRPARAAPRSNSDHSRLRTLEGRAA